VTDAELKALTGKFADAYEKTRAWSGSTWWPNLVEHRSEPAFDEMEFTLALNSDLCAEELAAIALALEIDPSRLEQEYEGGGCDSCGWGARTVVRVKRAPAPAGEGEVQR
jgi:hypothetical protein